MNIIQYLKNAAELEKALYSINKSISYLNYCKKDLGISYKYKEPEHPRMSGEYPSEIFITALWIEGLIGLPVSAIIAFITTLRNDFKDGTFAFPFWLWMFIIGCIALFIGLCIYQSMQKYYTQEYDKAMNAYKNDMEIYNNAVKANDFRVMRELEQIRVIEAQIGILADRKSEIADTLRRLYEMNIIYPKYRNFVAVTTFCEYMEAGRCNTLEGHEGAYNIFETEIRLNAIIGKLDDIVNRLEEIRTSQYAIYQAINEGNQTANAIYQQTARAVKKMEVIEDNTALASYNSSITARNTEVMKFIATYDVIRRETF